MPMSSKKWLHGGSRTMPMSSKKWLHGGLELCPCQARRVTRRSRTMPMSSKKGYIEVKNYAHDKQEVVT